MPKTTFVAVSPLTGKQFTRKSEREYTYAVVYSESIESQQIRAENEAKYCDAQAARYDAIAQFLETGTTPDATHKLRQQKSRHMFSLNEYAAGVRTEWDSVEYDIIDGAFGNTKSVIAGTRLENAARYRGWANDNITRAKAYRATQIDAPREAATFHHSNLLAVKAMANEGKRWTEAKVVFCTTNQK